MRRWMRSLVTWVGSAKYIPCWCPAAMSYCAANKAASVLPQPIGPSTTMTPGWSDADATAF